MVEVTDSGFTPENIADAEWLWTNLPTFPRNWSTLPTHEKALIVHTAIRHREAAAKAERDRLRESPDETAAVFRLTDTSPYFNLAGLYFRPTLVAHQVSHKPPQS